jgi:hypothetical protein
MKIDEKLVNKGQKRVNTKSYRHTFYPKGISDDDLFSHQFSPQGRAGGFHALRAALKAPTLLKARNSALWLRL